MAKPPYPVGNDFIDLPGQVEIDIETLAPNFLPALSGPSETRLLSRLQPFAPFSLGASSVSLLDPFTACSTVFAMSGCTLDLCLLSKMSLIAKVLTWT